MSLRRFGVLFLLMALLLSFASFWTVPALAETPYHITVDLTNQIVTIYSTEDESIVRQMLCSAGVQDSTPVGTYTMPENLQHKDDRKEWYHFKGFGVYAKYASRIYRGIMFHSLTCRKKNEATVYPSAVQAFGTPASHGCIRLRFADAEFIAKNCLKGTQVVIYKEDEIDADLRELLMESSYTNENGMSYTTFLGIPEDEEGVLSRSSVGDDVEYLQMRLRALGYFSEDIDGVYGTATIAAVKQVQRAMGDQATGYTTSSTLEKIYASDAPTATSVTLTEGMSGPTVRKLQGWLTDLKLYDGDIDGIYDGDVIDAVTTFQQVYGYATDGVATPTVQKALNYESERLEAIFNGEDYQLDSSTETVALATISAKVRVRIRDEATTNSKALESLKNGTTVMVLEQGKEWSHIRYGETTGYIRSDLLSFDDRSMSCLVYTSASGATARIGNNAEEYFSGAQLPAELFEQRLTAESRTGEALPKATLELSHSLNDIAIVNTGTDAVKLNMRKAASTDSDILAELSNGTVVDVVLKGEDWSLVNLNEDKGYLLNAYLDFASESNERSIFEDADEYEFDEEDSLTATVVKKCTVYDLDSEDAKKLGTLSSGTQVNIILSDDEWTMMEFKGKQGYIQNEYLQFNLAEEYI
ncbi:MAG: SH3 domain-containing protein [Clostridia bacterium]|nr:SH3 domain-containing protein [Clostridia bacterium]